MRDTSERSRSKNHNIIISSSNNNNNNNNNNNSATAAAATTKKETPAIGDVTAHEDTSADHTCTKRRAAGACFSGRCVQ
jgi:hypothetical protein